MWVACVSCVYLGRVWDASAHMIRHRSHTASPSIRLAIENGKIPTKVKDKLQLVIKAHEKAVKAANDVYVQLVKAAERNVVDGNSIATAKRNIVTAVNSSKKYMQLFDMYKKFEVDDESNALSEGKIIDELNESGRSLEFLFQACDNANALLRLAPDA